MPPLAPSPIHQHSHCSSSLPSLLHRVPSVSLGSPKETPQPRGSRRWGHAGDVGVAMAAAARELSSVLSRPRRGRRRATYESSRLRRSLRRCHCGQVGAVAAAAAWGSSSRPRRHGRRGCAGIVVRVIATVQESSLPRRCRCCHCRCPRRHSHLEVVVAAAVTWVLSLSVVGHHGALNVCKR